MYEYIHKRKIDTNECPNNNHLLLQEDPVCCGSQGPGKAFVWPVGGDWPKSSLNGFGSTNCRYTPGKSNFSGGGDLKLIDSKKRCKDLYKDQYVRDQNPYSDWKDIIPYSDTSIYQDEALVDESLNTDNFVIYVFVLK